MHRNHPSILGATLAALSLFSLPACTSDDSGEGTVPQTSEITGADVFTCVDDDLSAGQPFSGPGYKPSEGGLQAPLQEAYLASTTAIAIKPDEASGKRFFELTVPIIGQLTQMEGVVGWEVALSDKCGYGRTITVWRNEEAMMGFVMSDAHVAAMSESASVSTAAVVTSWEIPAAEIPLSWDVARAKAAATKISYGEPQQNP